MVIELLRTKRDKVCQTGELIFNGEHIGVTMSRLDNDPDFPAIPPGNYQGELRFSPHFGCLKIHFNYSDGEYMIHEGNVIANSHGCELVGTALSDDTPDFIADSKKMEAQLWALVCDALKTDRNISIWIRENIA